MSLAALHARLTDVIGIDPSTLSQRGVEGAVARRMRVLGIETLDAYAGIVGSDREEFDQLAAAVMVHETSFFRYPASFELLVREVRERFARHESATFRVHCVGCSTGEEPASIVMALLDAGIDPRRLRVEASDLSAHAIEYARAGRYRHRSARRVDPERLARHFSERDGALQLDPGIIEHIRYRQANVLDPAFGMDETPCDAILCRNLMIYLVPEARRRLLERLRAMLRPGGLLFVGHAEVAAARDIGLASAPPPDAFACRYVRAPSPAPAAAPPEARPGGPPARARPQRAAPPPAGAAADDDPLGRASQLADAGELDDARAILREAIRAGAVTAAHYHLLALVESARSEEAASEDALRKAIYLDANHYPSIVQLALAVEMRGDRAQAARLRDKAERARPAWEATAAHAAEAGHDD